MSDGGRRTEHLDVLVVGAGISGIGAAFNLKRHHPGNRFLVLDALDGFGGTWWTHRYPGVRSDSDLFTFGYEFKPWRGAPLASAEEILQVPRRGHRGERPRRGHPLPPPHHRRRLVERGAPLDGHRHRPRHRRGAPVHHAFLWMCQGYYKHARGLHARVAGDGGLRRRGRPPADLAGGPRPRGQAGRGHRLGRHRRHPHPRHRPRLRARDDAPALADVLLRATQRATSWPTRCAASTSPTSGRTRSCAARSSRTATSARRCPPSAPS